MKGEHMNRMGKATLSVAVVVATVAAFMAPVSAADVRLREVRGVLTITGTTADDSVIVCPVADGRLAVILDQFTPNRTVTYFEGVESIRASLARGDDSFRLAGGGDCGGGVDNVGGTISLSGNVGIYGGPGVDRIGINFATVGEDVVFVGGPDWDSLSINQTTIADRLTVNSGPGGGWFGFDFSSVGKLSYRGGSGADLMEMSVTDLGFASVVNTSSGADYVGLFDVTMTGRTLVNTGSGDDRLTWHEVTSGLQRVRVSMASGHDRLTVVGQYDRKTNIDGGGGADTAEVPADFGGKLRGFELTSSP